MADTELADEVRGEQIGFLVYDWAERYDTQAPVHMVADESMVRQRVAANCGAMPGALGWVIWYGSVPDDRQCEVCISRPVPRLRDDLTEAQLDGRACIRCGADDQAMRPVEAWSRQSSQLFECVDREGCDRRRLDASTGG